jgi:hypothetical protein
MRLLLKCMAAFSITLSCCKDMQYASQGKLYEYQSKLFTLADVLRSSEISVLSSVCVNVFGVSAEENMQRPLPILLTHHIIKYYVHDETSLRLLWIWVTHWRTTSQSSSERQWYVVRDWHVLIGYHLFTCVRSCSPCVANWHYSWATYHLHESKRFDYAKKCLKRYSLRVSEPELSFWSRIVW